MLKSVKRCVAAFSGLTLILSGATHLPLTRNQKAFYAEPNWVAFVRPGLAISIGVTALFLWFGIHQFRKVEKTFADLI